MEKDLTPIKYLGYCRKSSEDDSRQVLSLPSQIKEAQDIAERHDLKIVDIHAEAMSAKAAGRPELNKMLSRIEKGEAQGIICWKLDRLARNFIDGGRIIDLIQCGVIKEIRTHEKAYYPTDNVMMMAFEFGIANQFVRDLSANTKRGLQTKIAMGQPPRMAIVGYSNNLKTHNWEVDSKYAPIIIQIYEWYDSGAYSESVIVEKLKSLGVLTKSGRPFQKSLIARILRDPAYYGYFYAKGELYKGSYEILIDKVLWDRVQARLNGKVTCNHKKAKLVFKYRGLVRCIECGCSVTVERQIQCICTKCKKKFSKKKKDYCPDCDTKIADMDNPTIIDEIYYRCTKSKGRGTCSQRFIREEDLEPQLLKIFDGIQLERSDIEIVHTELIALYEKDQKLQNITLKNLKTELTKLEDEKRRIFKKMLLSDIEVDDREMVFELKQTMSKRIDAIKTQIDALTDNSYSWLEQSSNLLKLANRATELFLAGNEEQKAQLINFVASNLVLSDKKVLFEYKNPFALMTKIKSLKSERPDISSGRPIWLPR